MTILNLKSNNMKKSTWTVTLHFNRGSVEVLEFTDKKAAQEAVRIAVFSNEDCINCSIYKKEEIVRIKSEPLDAVYKM